MGGRGGGRVRERIEGKVQVTAVSRNCCFLVGDRSCLGKAPWQRHPGPWPWETGSPATEGAPWGETHQQALPRIVLAGKQ